MVSMCFRRLHIHLNISQLLMTLSSQSGRIHHNETYFHSRLHFFVFKHWVCLFWKKKVTLLSASQSVCECQSLREWQLKKEWKYKTAKAITENASNERGRGWRRGRVDSRTLGNESAALVMKRTDRELKGMKGGRRWRQQELKPMQTERKRCFSHVGVVFLPAQNIIYFSLLLDCDTQEEQMHITPNRLPALVMAPSGTAGCTDRHWINISVF